MKLLLHPAVTALGLSLLYCLGLIAPLISADHLWIYHDSGSPAAAFLPVLIDIAIVWGLLTLLLLLPRRHGRTDVYLWSGLVLSAPWLLLEDGAMLRAWTFTHRLSVAVLLTSSLCWLAVAVLWRPAFVPAFERVRTTGNTILAFVAFSSVLVIGQLLWFFWRARDLQAPRPLHVRDTANTTAPEAPKSRVVWIVLDELSYQQLYERRFPSVQLPAFDQLAAQSTVFTHAIPAANYTEEALPSLMTGTRVDIVRASPDGASISMHDSATNQWQPFRPQDTVFQDALDRGYDTGIAGWYNPYCRMLPSLLDRCVWTYRLDYNLGLFGDGSTVSNTLDPWLRALALVLLPDHGKRRVAEKQNQAHIDDIRELGAAADDLLEDPSLNFLLLHMPFPHPGGVYDRRTSAFTTFGASYLDNLVLADHYLAHIRQLLTARGEWDSTTIVIMGDHSWRTSLVWNTTAYWTAEDQAASQGGEFDPRPAYIVKLPHQTAPAHIDRPFAAVHTRALLDGIFSGNIGTPADLAAFAAQASPPPDQNPARGSAQPLAPRPHGFNP